MAADPHSRTKPPWEFAWEDWQEAAGDACAPGTAPEAVRHWFDRRFQNPEEARWKLQRFEVACSYLESHRGEFAEFEVVTTRPDGTTGAMVSPHLHVALFSWFTEVPDASLSIEPDVAYLLSMARESVALGD